MNQKEWIRRWESALSAIQSLGGRTHKLSISPPADFQEIFIAEAKLKRQIPLSLKSVIAGFSSAMDFYWQLPEKFAKPRPVQLRGVFCGDCRWNLSDLIRLENERQDWINNCFSNPQDSYDVIWHDKFAFLDVPNGDMLAIDNKDQSVIYLSHDGSSLHGVRLGTDFEDFIDKWTQLGCTGPEDWQFEPFIQSKSGGLDVNCKNADLLREWLGFKFE